MNPLPSLLEAPKKTIASQPMVELNQVMKQFGKREIALKPLTLSIRKGEMIAIAGPDGAGKTTLLRLIAGLLLPTEGDLYVAGWNSKTHADHFPEKIGYMPQKFGLYEDLSVLQNLQLYAKLRALPSSEEVEVINNLLKATSLEPFPHRLAGNLSGGMKQKLGLACALLRKPQLLILDEPTVGVDPVSRLELWKMVQDLLYEGVTVLWSTAYLEDVERCNQVLLLNQGEMQFFGKPQDLTQNVAGRVFSQPVPLEKRRFFLQEVITAMPIRDATIQGESVRIVMEKAKKAEPPWMAVAPRFEDAFVDLLGGIAQERSALSSYVPQIPLMPGLAIEAKNLTKRFGSFTAANEISLAISQGEIFGLLGPNGAGKTTTFKMLCGLLKPSAGFSRVAGINIQACPAKARMQMGYMAQKFSLYDTLSVWQNLVFFSGVYNLTGKAQRKAIDEMVELFHFEDYINTAAGLLPLGFKQRLALACSLMHNPAILFLDEPTSGVDPLTRREFWAHILALVEKGVTVLVTTHFMDEAEYCSRIGLVYRSHMILEGSPDFLKERAAVSGKPFPTLEEAFIHHIEAYEHEHPR